MSNLFHQSKREIHICACALCVLLLKLELLTDLPHPLRNFRFWGEVLLGLQYAVDMQVHKQASLEKDGEAAGQEDGTCWTEAQGQPLIRSPTRWRHHEARTSRTCGFGSTRLRKGLNTQQAFKKQLQNELVGKFPAKSCWGRGRLSPPSVERGL